MANNIIRRFDGESEEQFLWRLGQLKDSGVKGLSWDDVADIMNKEFRKDESEYRDESAYRKPYQQAKSFFEQGVFEQYDKDSYIKELREEKHKIRKEKQKLFDERTALNKTLRETARGEENFAKLEEVIRETGKLKYESIIKGSPINSANDLVVPISDLHIGLNSSNNFGEFNLEIAKARLKKYLEKIITIKMNNYAKNVYILLLGDIISGNIHTTIQLENRENVIEQVKNASELLSDFAYELAQNFDNVYINSVAGNHSRLGLKDNVLRNERLDDLVPWYMEAKLSHISNVHFIDNKDNYDSTIGAIKIKNSEYLLVHGDFDAFSEAGLSKLIMAIGHKPTGVWFAHMHHCSYDEIADVAMIRSGCFSGTCDDYTASKRITGKPSQMVCVTDINGEVLATYPVKL